MDNPGFFFPEKSFGYRWNEFGNKDFHNNHIETFTSMNVLRKIQNRLNDFIN
jgi:hypothetical protein